MVVAVGLLLAACGYTVYTVLRSRPAAPSAIALGQRTLRGTVTCLPKQGGGPQTLECALGLQTSAGVYALSDIDQAEMERLDTGQAVTVTGEVTPRRESQEQYAIVGSIEVQKVEK